MSRMGQAAMYGGGEEGRFGGEKSGVRSLRWQVSGRAGHCTPQRSVIQVTSFIGQVPDNRA
jgi:hypothetical protein